MTVYLSEHDPGSLQAALISDLRLRACFLTHIAENRDIAQGWQAANSGAPAA